MLEGCLFKNPRAPASEVHEMCRLIRNAKREVETKKYTVLTKTFLE